MNNQTQKRKVVCGDRSIEYILTRKKVKNINLRIKPDGIVYISAGRNVPASYIDDIVRQRADRIIEALNRYEKRRQEAKPARIYTGDEDYSVIYELCDEIYPIFEKMGVKYPVIKIKYLKSKWGSCMPGKGVLTFNCRLLEVPRECVEYVVLHEFAHFIHPNHSREFYGLVEEFMPDWKSRKKRLNEVE